MESRASTKVPRRSRWNANQQQLQMLESMFEQGNGNTPNKTRIKEIALELSQFGPISDTNVYNWFQNRKARAKRKLQHQVGRRRRLTRSTTDHAPKASRKVKAGEDAEVASPRAKRVKTEREEELQQQLVPNEPLGLAPNEPGSSGVDDIDDEGVLDEHLRSHVDYATLASDPQLPNVDHISADLLFTDHHIHDPGTIESPNGQLKEISEEVEAWDVRTPFGESSHIVESQIPYHSSNDDEAVNFPSGLVGENTMISLAGGPVPSMMDESRKGVIETRGLKIHEEAIHIQAVAVSEKFV